MVPVSLWSIGCRTQLDQGHSGLVDRPELSVDGVMGTRGNVSEVMSHPVVFADPNATLGRLAAMFVDHHVGAIPVVAEAGRVVGMITESDLVRASDGSMSTAAAEATTVRAADVMTEPVVAAGAEESIEGALLEMRRCAVGRLPVLDEDGRLAGVVSGSDLLHGVQRVEDAGDVEIRRRVVDRVIDAGGEVLAVAVDRGVVRLRICYGEGDLPLIRHMLGAVPGVVDLELTVDRRAAPGEPMHRCR